MPILAIRSSTRSLQSTEKRGFRDQTQTHTHTHTTDGHRDLETELAERADSVNIYHRSCSIKERKYTPWCRPNPVTLVEELGRY